MQQETLELLRAAVVSATEDREDIQESNLAALDQLAKACWPRVAGLKRVRVQLHVPGWNHEPSGWVLAEDEKAVHWLTQNYRVETAYRTEDKQIEARQLDVGTEADGFDGPVLAEHAVKIGKVPRGVEGEQIGIAGSVECVGL